MNIAIITEMHNIRNKLIISMHAFGRLLRSPTFIFLSLLIAVFLFIVFRFFFSGDILFGVLFSPALSFTEKLSYITIGFIPSSFAEFTIMFSDGFVITLLLLAFVQGFALSAYIWIAQQRIREIDQVNLRSVGLALFGSGCVACGSSIIAPLFTGFSATTATFFIQLIGNIFLIIALFVAVYGLYKMLLAIAITQAKVRIQ